VLRAIEWILFGLGSTAAIIIGVRRHRPARAGPWFWLAGSVVSLAIGDVFFAFEQFWVADLFYLANLALAAVSLMRLTRGGSLLVNRARLIDLLAFTCAVLLVVWVFVIGDSHQIGQIPAADVIGDLLFIGVACRVIVATRRNVSALLLLTGALGMLASDIIYGLAPSHLAETGYMLLYVAWGAAALHPSMPRLTEPAPVRPDPWRGRWAALLCVSVATPPAVLLIEAVNGTLNDGVVIAVAGGLTLMLTITRLTDSIAQNSQALSRERGLREASAALVAASDVPAVDKAVRAAIGELMPATAISKIVFATDDRQLTLAALPSAHAGPRSWWLQGTNDVEGTLVCPLWLEPLAVARPSGGALVLTGRRDILTASSDALEVLAGQVSLALDRISLVEAVGRRDSDLYLRAVIRNTADMMLVIDEDQRIRYASPALREILGQGDIPPLTTLQELVHPDDRTEVRQALQTDGDGTVFCALQCTGDRQVLVEATYRDLREDRLVQGFVITMRDVTNAHQPDGRRPGREHLDELPAWLNRRSARGKFRY
jgi:PAS domain S-box-containing protein